ncbi:MAG: hypothetical protein ABIE47_08560 [Pseudomonadota bacterium]
MWVSFDLGRPLGTPYDAAFQTRVLIAALRLLEASNGPVIEDFPEDAPRTESESTVWACPIDLGPEEKDVSDLGQLRLAFKREMTQLRPWYDLALKKRGRTTVGVSGLDIEILGDFISGFMEGNTPENPRKDLPVALVLKLAADDLKAFYIEAASGQPGQPLPGNAVLSDWFWGETVAGKVLLAVKQHSKNSDDKMLRVVGEKLIVPIAQASRS